jgi:hypothetical protein
LKKIINEINANPNAARPYLKNYTSLSDELIQQTPLPIWKTRADIKESDLDALQKFVDLFTTYKVIDGKVNVRDLMYTK